MPKGKEEEPDEEGWEYGDVWKEGSPGKAAPGNDVSYVEILRVDTGMGYDDTAMLDLISYLGSFGIRATYNSVSLGLEFGVGGVKTYVLKVEAGKEKEAKEYLEEKSK